MLLCLPLWTKKSSTLPALVILLSAVAASWAQQSEPKQDVPDAPSATRKADSSASRKPHGALGTIRTRSRFFPDIATSPGPLSPSGKFELFISDSLSLDTVAESGLDSAIGQATNFPEGYRQGWEGYGKRFGSSMARRASSEFFGTFLLASMLGQDPRFFPQTEPTFSGSIKYSVRRLFITASDDGRDVPNWSGLLGPLFSEGLANSYWPDEDRDVNHTFQRYGLDLATVVGTNMLRNYWPVFFKRLRHADKRQQQK